MDYSYSLHFQQRMQERKISEFEVEILLTEAVETIQIPSKKDPQVILLLGYVNLKGIALIINKKTKVLITVRRMRNNEEQLFGGQE